MWDKGEIVKRNKTEALRQGPDSSPNTLLPHVLQHARFPVLHYFLELTQTHVHWVGDAIQLFHPLLSPSPPAFNLSQHQGLNELALPSDGENIGTSASASVLPMNIQGWFPLGLTCLISLLSKGLSRVFSSTTVWKGQFFGVQPSWWSNSHIHAWLLENPQLWLYWALLAKWCFCFLVCRLGWS